MSYICQGPRLLLPKARPLPLKQSTDGQRQLLSHRLAGKFGCGCGRSPGQRLPTERIQRTAGGSPGRRAVEVCDWLGRACIESGSDVSVRSIRRGADKSLEPIACQIAGFTLHGRNKEKKRLVDTCNHSVQQAPTNHPTDLDLADDDDDEVVGVRGRLHVEALHVVCQLAQALPSS